MALEIEAKMRLMDPQALRQRLADVGGVFNTSCVEVNSFFDTADQSLLERDCALRLRVERTDRGPQKVILTYKGPRTTGILKSRDECELQVSSAQEAEHLLISLGYQRQALFEKIRERWLLGGCRVELDTLPFLGHYLEIEGPDEASVLAVRDRLTFAREPLVSTSYIGLMVKVARERGLDTAAMTFTQEAHWRAAAHAPVQGV